MKRLSILTTLLIAVVFDCISNAHKTLRQLLVEVQKLDAVISLHGGDHCVTKTNSGGTEHFW